MRILIVGGGGMLGHELWRKLHKRHEVWVTLRKPAETYAKFGLFEEGQTISGVDVSTVESIVPVFRKVKPEAVINCVGIIKQLKEAYNPILSLTINSLLPHRLSELCGATGARLVHISTDCVFSGKRGNYTEKDFSDADDLYGRTKFMGELHESHCVTIRTSIIGRELETKSGLIEWFLSQAGKTINGYRKAIYTGFTTLEMSRIIESVLTQHTRLSGLWHVTSDPINKYQLLQIAKSAFNWSGEILPDDTFVCDRSMLSERFREETKYRPPSWQAMIHEMSQNPA